MEMLAKKGEDFFLAVIGDIRGSRQSDDRQALQQRLEAGLVATNQQYRSALAAEFVITLGDEFQGLLRVPGAAMEVVVTLEAALPEIPICYGMGWGTLTTSLRSQAVGMDGPCFHAARDTLEWGKRAKQWVTVQDFGTGNDAILNSFLNLMGGVRARWKRRQAETVALMRNARYQKDVAATRGVVESVVSDTLKAALYGPMVEAERALAQLLERFAEP